MAKLPCPKLMGDGEVVDQVHAAYKYRADQHDGAAAQETAPELSRLRRVRADFVLAVQCSRCWDVVRHAPISRRDKRLGQRCSSEEGELYDGKNGIAVSSVKAVEGLLLNSKGDAQGVGDRHLAQTVIYNPLQAFGVGNHDLITDVVIGVKTFAL